MEDVISGLGSIGTSSSPNISSSFQTGNNYISQEDQSNSQMDTTMVSALGSSGQGSGQGAGSAQGGGSAGA